MNQDSNNYRGGYNYSGLLTLVRDLRRRQTPAETIFWEIVRNRRFHGLKFRRQQQIGQLIADFYCHEKKLVVELDGGIHCNRQQLRSDRERDTYLCSLGLTVFRVQNDFLLNAPQQVIEDMSVIIRSL